MPKQIIFDLGAVVFRWEPLQLLREIFADKAPDDMRVAHWAAEIFRSFEPDSEWARFDKGLLEAHQVAQAIAARTDFRVDEITGLIAAVPLHLQRMEQTVDLIEALKRHGHQLYFLSNMPAPFAQHLVGNHDFDRWFIDGIFSAHVHQIKPEPEIFDIAVRRWQLEQPIFIDDSIKNIEAARSLGWQSIRFQSASQLEDELNRLGILRR